MDNNRGHRLFSVDDMKAPNLGPVAVSGQGKQLPTNFPYQGQWIHQDSVFLYLPIDGQARSVELSVAVATPHGHNAYGFNAATVAQAFNISVADLMDHNARRSLVFVSVDRIEAPEGKTRSSFRFRIGETDQRFEIEIGPFGTA